MAAQAVWPTISERDPLGWEGYMSQAFDVPLRQEVAKGDAEPTSPTPTSCIRGYGIGLEHLRKQAQARGPQQKRERDPMVLLLIHGAGMAGLSWAVTCREIQKLRPNLPILVPDLRGHGHSVSSDDTDLSIATLATDLRLFLETLLGEDTLGLGLYGTTLASAAASAAGPEAEREAAEAKAEGGGEGDGGGDLNLSGAQQAERGQAGPSRRRFQVIVAGHSLGGAVATRLATLLQSSSANSRDNSGAEKTREAATAAAEAAQAAAAAEVQEGGAARPCGCDLALQGLVLLDAVEGTALASLAKAEQALRAMPPHFPSPNHAIEWVLASRAVSNIESARLSTPPRLRLVQQARQAATADGATTTTTTRGTAGSLPVTAETEAGAEEPVWEWRSDLLAAREHWDGWFAGLDETFLRLTCPRLLMVSNIQHLDTDLTIAQMQGKIQVRALQNCGHAMHEDGPRDVAKGLVAFSDFCASYRSR